MKPTPFKYPNATFNVNCPTLTLTCEALDDDSLAFPGVYIIEHIQSHQVYIGEAKNIGDRLKKHRRSLRKYGSVATGAGFDRKTTIYDVVIKVWALPDCVTQQQRLLHEQLLGVRYSHINIGQVGKGNAYENGYIYEMMHVDNDHIGIIHTFSKTQLKAEFGAWYDDFFVSENKATRYDVFYAYSDVFILK